MSAAPDVSQDQLALARALTERTKYLCDGLESGEAPIFELVTPTTAELLRWWFDDAACAARPGFNFHEGQKQAILNTIVAHEVLNTSSLKNLYQLVCEDALKGNDRLAEVSQPRHDYPKYCLKMATGTGKTWVLQALLIWQFANKNAALEAGYDDLRFTRRFLLVAPGLIVYERLLDAFCGKAVNGVRDFSRSDIVANARLFIPEALRERLFAFVRNNVCQKHEIGQKATGNGMIAITNWHVLAEAAEELADDEQQPAVDATADPASVVSALLPVVPGRSTGNSLEQLDRRFARGRVLDFLAGLPDLLAFNDEAHHIHEIRRAGEVEEVEWQSAMLRIAAAKGRRFTQIDFSATPYNDLGSGRKKSKRYFPHIIVDFDLPRAMRLGLVKSLVLDRRKEIGALPLEFTAERDDDGKPVLSEGQRLMLRAGLQKLYKLEADFAPVDPGRHPKMLVVCEDTNVSPLVARFLCDEGLAADEVMTIDSGRKAELGPKEWGVVRERLFDVDRHRKPRVIVSVLMLREGFDVSNICVIVPLRSSQAQILLEQIIGRGLRLMWRDPEYADIKLENRQRINKGEEPASLIDILSIIEHPAFSHYYDDLMKAGVAGSTTELIDRTSGAGDMITVELRDGFEQYDFALPFILREQEEWVEHHPIDVHSVPPYSAMTLDQLKALQGKGDTFSSLDLQSSTLFGSYRVHGAIMSVSSYNDWLARITRRISQALAAPLPRGNRIADAVDNPYLQTNMAMLAGAVDEYVATRLFGGEFEALADENWRLLLLQPVVDHIVEKFAFALTSAREHTVSGETEVRHRRLSEVRRLTMRASNAVDVQKCIYPKLAYPAQSGGLEKAFIGWAQRDSGVLAFCRINETRHDFARLRYIREDGMAAFYSPDFLVRTQQAIYIVETKSQQQLAHPNVVRKLKAAVAWCERINELPAELRSDLPWHYVLLGEGIFYEWLNKNATLAELLAFKRERPSASVAAQEKLGF